MPILKPQITGPLYSNTVIGTLAVDGWAVTSGTARRGLGGLARVKAMQPDNTNSQTSKSRRQGSKSVV